MDRQYLRQTKSSLAKSKEPHNLRDRLQTLSATVSELKNDVRQELTAAETLERMEKQVIQTQNHQNLASQVQALRRAFSELADAVADEVEHLQEDTKTELRREIRGLAGRVEALTDQSQTCVRGVSELNVAVTGEIRRVGEAVVDVQRNQDNLHAEVAELKETLLKTQDDNKQVFEQMRSILHNNITHVASLQKGMKRSNEEVKALLEQLERSARAIEDVRKGRTELEEKLTNSVRTIEEKLIDLSVQTKSLAATSNIQERNHSSVSQLSTKIQEIAEATQQRFDRLNTYIDDKTRDLEHQFDTFKSHIDSDFKPPDSAQSEDREFRQRIDYLESMLQTQRREIFASLTTLEQNSTKKHDSIIKAIYQIARELNLQNPLAAF
jgi:DNA repair exonuclease SbcCD ATPase subunit